MKPWPSLPGGFIFSRLSAPLIWFVVGAALRRDSTKPSRRKAAPTGCRHTAGLVLALWATAAVVATTAQTTGPEISISLRGVADGIVEQGEPLRIAVRLEASRETTGAVALAPASGSWIDTITVELAPASGGAAIARAEAVGKADTPHATLDATHIAGGLWRFSSDAMRRVAPGDYAVRARLVIRDGGGWNGEVVSDDALLGVVAASDSVDRVSQRVASLAQDALLAGNLEEAASIIDATLTNATTDFRLLTVRAMVAERAGNPVAAMLCVNLAQRLRAPDAGGPPPLDLDEMHTRLAAALAASDALPANPPVWSWPPLAIFSRPEAGQRASAPAAAAPAPEATPVPYAVASASPAAPSTSAQPVAAPPLTPAKTPSSANAAGAIVIPASELTDAKVAATADGQWAASAIAGSQYGKTQYSAAKATGAPDIRVAGNSPDAWCPENKNTGTDWIEVSFAKPVHATEVRVRQNDTVGAIAKIEAIAPDGTTHVWWEGVDPFVTSTVRDIAWFAVRVPRTDYLVAKVKITLNLAAVTGWKEIDAVQLVGSSE